MLAWLLTAAIGPAAVALPVNWAADPLADAARRWLSKLLGKDDLSRLVRSAAGSSFDLSRAELRTLRELLEDRRTWSNLIGRGTAEDLANQIADCLPPRDGRTSGESKEAALIIARGLLEFAFADLEPKTFQQVLLARLERMELGEASALDEAMVGLHAQFDSVIEQLKLVLDRLPPGPAHRGQIEVYLRALIDWLNTDPWPRDLAGSALTPAAIERKLRVAATGGVREQNLDADELTQHCRRLIILGGPGSGKTWLARRSARRCAEDALEALAAGGALDEVELPLYTTCSRLVSAPGDIRNAAVSSALEQLGDLGGSRISAALHLFFTERNSPTLLVIDSLDEAHGPRERLRQAGTLPWRIVLTSRESTWKEQLTISKEDESHRVGALQPLRYPGDVEPFISRWFAGQRDLGQGLAMQIALRPSLQQAATVPLILAFYCIVAGSGPLPEFRHDLYSRVLKRLLTGRWRGDDKSWPDLDTCLRTLQDWAWSAADSDSLSGIGAWKDDFPTRPIRLEEADSDAVDHVATPLGPPDFDTQQVQRRFIHRSFREHLVAEHVADLPVQEVADTLLPHLWFDPDWEYVVPAALAMHPDRDRLVRELILRVAGSDQLPGDLSVIDAGWEVRGILARVATESRWTDWSPEVAGLIGQARVALAQSGRAGALDEAASWADSNHQAREAVLGLLAGETDFWAGFVYGVTQLVPMPEDKRQTREALLGLLVEQADSTTAIRLAGEVAKLDPTAEDTRQARQILLGLLADETDGWAAAELVNGVADLDPTVEEKCQARDALLAMLADGGWSAEDVMSGVLRVTSTADDKREAREALLELVPGQTDAETAVELANAVALLDPTAEDTRQTRRALLEVLAEGTENDTVDDLVTAVVELTPTAEDKQQVREDVLVLLAEKTEGGTAGDLASLMLQLDPTAEDTRRARQALLALLRGQTDAGVAVQLVGGMADLDPTAEDARQARDVLLALLAGETNRWTAADLVSGVVDLDPTAEDRRQAREALLAMLTRTAGGGPTEETGSWASDALSYAMLVLYLVKLAPGSQDKHELREALLGLLHGEADGQIAAQLAAGVVELDPTAEDKYQARQTLFALLAEEADGETAAELAATVAQLDPAAEEKRQIRRTLLTLLPGETDGQIRTRFVRTVLQLAPTAEDKQQTREALLALLPGITDRRSVKELVSEVIGLAPTPEEKQQTREALLALLTREIDSATASTFVRTAIQLATTPEDKQQTMEALLALLAGQADVSTANALAEGIVRLDPTAQEKQQARAALVALLAGRAEGRAPAEAPGGVAQLDPAAEDKRQAVLALHPELAYRSVAGALMDRLAELDPKADDLSAWRAWAVQPTVQLFTAARRNSATADWIRSLTPR
jgi:hypothetical protein